MNAVDPETASPKRTKAQPKSFGFEDLLRTLKRIWFALAGATLWIGGIIVPLLSPPAFKLPAVQPNKFAYLAQLILTILAGLMIAFGQKHKSRKHVLPWAILCAAFLILGSTGFFVYEARRLDWTLPYAGNLYLKGAEMTQDAKDLIQKVGLTEAQAFEQLSEAGYNKFQIWTQNSIQSRWIVLAGIYVASFQFFAICIIALTQTIRCVDPSLTASGSGRRRAAKPKEST